MKSHRSPLVFIIIVLLFPLLLVGGAAARNPQTVLVLPFNIHSEKDLSFLQNGIRDMLSSRLGQEGKVRVLGRDAVDEAMDATEEVNESVAADLGQTAGADFVVFGGLTVFGDNISTDARIYNVGEGKSALTFYETGEDPGDVISHINRFASQVNAEVFDRKPAPKTAATDRAPDVAESRQHPESLWNKSGRKVTEEIEGTVTETGGGPLGESWRSRHFDAELRHLALGDVDGDGNTEIVLGTGKDVSVYRVRDRRFIKIGEVPGDANDKIISVDVGDINENGLAEIFVTKVNEGNDSLDSYVLEWDNGRFLRILSGADWYYRVLDIPDRDRVLMGQQRSIRNLFTGGVEEMKWTGGEYAPSMPQALPPWTNIYGFNYADFTDRNADMTVAFNEKDYLRVLGPEGDKEWESTETYGGSAIYLEFPMEAASRIGEHKEMDRQYLPLRILTRDITGDGKSEVLVAKNRDAAGRLFSRVRIYKGGHIECLGWDDFGLVSRWKTPEVSGQITDYALGDLNNDGKTELVFSVIQKISSVIGTPRSYIAAMEITGP
ncbi:MAG: FG-GAP-like repeat-containing protein [Thermodesulfobacteriota bacterium]